MTGSDSKQRPKTPVKLTQALIEAFAPETTRYEVRDAVLPGLRVRITPAGVKTFCLIYRDRQRRQIRYTVGRYGKVTLKRAREIAQEVLGEIAGRNDPQEQKRKARQAAAMPTLSQFLDGEYGEWVKTHRKAGKATLARLRACFNQDLGSKRLNAITQWQAEKWQSRRLREGREKTTINRDMTALKAMFSKAVQWGVIETHPLAPMKPLKVDKHSRTRFLAMEEEERLRQAIDQRDARIKRERVSANAWRKRRGYTPLPEITGYADHMKPMVLLSLNTGLRRGELFQLRWSEVILAQRNLTVHGNTAKSHITRHVPLNDEALEVLTAWKDQQRDLAGLVFPGREGEPFNNVAKAWASILDAAKVLDFRWHDLRHTFASKLVMSGVDLNTVRELLGHSDITMTLRYAHLAPEHKAEAVSRLVSRCATNHINAGLAKA